MSGTLRATIAFSARALAVQSASGQVKPSMKNANLGSNFSLLKAPLDGIAGRYGLG